MVKPRDGLHLRAFRAMVSIASTPRVEADSGTNDFSSGGLQSPKDMTTMNLSEVKLIDAFFGVAQRPAQRDIQSNSVVRGWQSAKRITLAILLAGAFMFYYVLDKLNQGLSAF